MERANLTLQYPQGLKGLPITTTTNAGVLRFFKRCIFDDWRRKVEQAHDEGEAMLYGLEYQRLRTALSIFISDNEAENEG